MLVLATAEKGHLHKSLLQIPHDFLPDRPLHAEVALDVLDVVLRQGLAIVDLQQQLNNTSLVCAKQCSNNSSQKHWVTFAGDHPAMHSQQQSRRFTHFVFPQTHVNMFLFLFHQHSSFSRKPHFCDSPEIRMCSQIFVIGSQIFVSGLQISYLVPHLLSPACAPFSPSLLLLHLPLLVLTKNVQVSTFSFFLISIARTWSKLRQRYPFLVLESCREFSEKRFKSKDVYFTKI